MRSLGALSLTVMLLGLACGGQKAPTDTPVATPPVTTPPVTTPPPVTTTPATPAPVLSLQAPALVSAGMTGITAAVPVQSGATYAWSLTGGTIPGVRQNAAVTFTAGAIGTVSLQCLVTVAGVVTTHAKDVAVVAPLEPAPSYYGSGLSADSLANTQVGGVALNSVSYRFRTRQAGTLDAIRIFFIWSTVKTGYQAGHGGTVQVDLLADDGTAAHLPTGASLATLSYGNILARNLFYPRLPFPVPANLQGGTLYHLVFTNLDPEPANNFISLDTLYTNAQTAPMQATVSDTDWAVLVRPGAGAWKPRPGFTPTLDLEYGDGGHQGNGYMEVWSTNPKTISGQAGVRQTFRISGASRAFTKVLVRLQRVAGTSPLTLKVAEADGTLIAQGTVPAAEILQSAAHWVTLAFPLSQVLASGVAYNLELACPADTQYVAFPLRKGLDKGFSEATCFHDGYAQFTTTGPTGWAGWDMWETPNLTFSDLQFLFVP